MGQFGRTLKETRVQPQAPIESLGGEPTTRVSGKRGSHCVGRLHSGGNKGRRNVGTAIVYDSAQFRSSGMWCLRMWNLMIIVFTLLLNYD